MLTKRLLAGPRTATTGVVVGARRRALEAGRNMMGVGARGEVRGGGREKVEERKTRGGQRDDVQLGVELEERKRIGADEVKRERELGSWWPEAESCLIGDGWSRCMANQRGVLVYGQGRVHGIQSISSSVLL